MIITENGRGTEIVMRKDSRISGRWGTDVSEGDLSKFWFMWDHTPSHCPLEDHHPVLPLFCIILTMFCCHISLILPFNIIATVFFFSVTEFT